MLKIPPHNIEAEQYVLSACLTRPEIIKQVSGLLRSEDFYNGAHSIIFQALENLGEAADHITLTDWLGKRNLLDNARGEKYLSQLIESPGISAGWKYHAELIKDAATRRELIRACQDAGEAARGIESLEEILSKHKTAIRSIGTESGHREISPLALCKQVFAEIERRYETKNPFVGIQTGLKNIDLNAWGMEASTTVYLIARPSMGKTALALQIADYVSQHYGSVVFYSLESSAKALMRRRLASTSHISLTALRTARMDDEDWRALIRASDKLSGNERFIIQDDPKFKQIERLTGNALSIAMDQNISLVVIDHIQLMRTAKKTQSRHLEISEISNQLIDLAKELNIPVLVLCQLSRWIEREKVRRPQLSAMKESGDLEQNADIVWSLYRETMDSELAWVDCLKGRDTGTWSTKLTFKRHTQRFFDVVDQEEEEQPDKENERGFGG